MNDARTLPRAVSRCSQNLGYHSHMAGPCFDTEEQAVRYRDACEYSEQQGIPWRGYGGWPTYPPEGWVNPNDALSSRSGGDS